jgi:hypothetical protein
MTCSRGDGCMFGRKQRHALGFGKAAERVAQVNALLFVPQDSSGFEELPCQRQQPFGRTMLCGDRSCRCQLIDKKRQNLSGQRRCLIGIYP